MEEMFSNLTATVNSFMGWVGSTEQYGQYWIMQYIVLPASAWALIAWVSLWLKCSHLRLVRTLARAVWWAWLVTSSVLVAYVVAWYIWYAVVAIHWIELSGGTTYGWGHNWPLPMWIWMLFVPTVVVGIVMGLEHRNRPKMAGLHIFWWYGASAKLSPDDDTLADLPVVHKV